MIELNEDIVGIWYLVTIQNVQDYMMVVSACEDGRYHIQYRFRYYLDDKVFRESSDMKSWYSFYATKSKDEVIALADKAIALQRSIGAEGQIYRIINDRGFDDFMERFMNAPFVHKREATPEDLQDLGLDKSGRPH